MIRQLCSYLVSCDAGACLAQHGLTYHGPAIEGAMLEFVKFGWKRDGARWTCPKHAGVVEGAAA